MITKSTLTIARRFCGPADSGNGGYVCGRLAEHIEGPAEVTLFLPPPLEKELELEVSEPEVRLLDGGQLVAQARPAPFELEVPPAPTTAQAIIGSERYYGFAEHAFESCFVCGPQRQLQDGLRIFAGPYNSEGNVAASWTPSEDLFDADGLLMERYIWAALDCPGYAAVAGAEHPVMVLGKLNAKILGPVRKGETLTVAGWKRGQERRKYYAGTALYTDSGELVAFAKATWIRLKQ